MSISEKLLVDAKSFQQILQRFCKIISKYNRTRSSHNYAIEKNPAFPEFRKHGSKNLEIKISTYLWVATTVPRYLSQLVHSSIVNISDIGLYCGDGLGIFYNVSKPEIERKKKAIVKVFKGCGLTITTQCNLKTVDFLDVTFDLAIMHINHFAKKTTSKFI